MKQNTLYKMSFFKFPRTPHIFTAQGVNVRDDKVLTKEEAVHFLSAPVVVEEKIDGANIGISFYDLSELKIQNRGNFIEPGFSDQFEQLWTWAYNRMELLERHLEGRYILFGEWCYAKHSIHYTQLPDYFVGFDLFDKETGLFLSTKRRNEIFEKMQITEVPLIGQKQYTASELSGLLNTSVSAFYDGPPEGVYLRRENDEQLIGRAKLVNSDFIHHISEHWSKGALIKNELSNPTALKLNGLE